MRVTRLSSTVVIGVLAAAALAACGSGGGADSASGKGAITLGVLGSFSGSASAALGPAKNSIQAWADSVNARGGLDGHKINLIVMDDGGVASTGIADAQQLVQDKVTAFVDQQWGPYVKRAGIPIIGGFEGAFSTSPDFFPSGTTAAAVPALQLKLGLSKGADKIAVAYCAEIASCANQADAYAPLAAKIGSKVVWTGKFLANAPSESLTAPCLAAKASGANGILINDAPPAQVKFMTACYQQNFKPIIIDQGSGVDKSFLPVPAFGHMLAVEENAPWFDTSLPAIKQMTAAIKKYQPTAPIASVSAWASGMLFEAAYKAAGSPASPTSQEIINGLYKLRNETVGGLTAPLTYNKDKTNTVNCAFVIGISDGKFITPNGLNLTCLGS
jgi:branched-chain amino acid transport system substrate-binding protein